MKAMHLASEFSDRQLRLQKSLRCEHAKSKDCFWSNELNLTEQIWAAGGYFVGHRFAVARRAMLQHVADERVFALQVDCRENFGEQLTGGADEWPARFILGRSRRFSDNHEIGGRTALARHGVGGGRIERAARARPDRLSYRLQRVELCERAAEQLAVVAPDDETERGKWLARGGNRGGFGWHSRGDLARFAVFRALVRRRPTAAEHLAPIGRRVFRSRRARWKRRILRGPCRFVPRLRSRAHELQ